MSLFLATDQMIWKDNPIEIVEKWAVAQVLLSSVSVIVHWAGLDFMIRLSRECG